MQRSTKVTFAAALFSVVLSACGGSSTSAPVEIPATVDLEVRAVSGLKFDASAYTATAGDVEVAYINEDTIRHNLIVAEGDTKVGSFQLLVNKKGDVDLGTINLPAGTYLLLCTVPGHQNMKADLTVK
jgi:plastocyanin